MAIIHFRSECDGDESTIFTQQGPPGKDGLPGHPGQRGETVSPNNPISYWSLQKTVAQF